MLKIFLNVSYAEKDKAKALGAKWDGEKKSWYITSTQDKNKFSQWIEEERIPNIKSYGFTICKGYEICWKCKQISQVIGILLPKNHEMFDHYIDIWDRVNYQGFAFYLCNINAGALKYINGVTQNYKLRLSKTTNSSYYMNTCQYCDASLGDFHLYHLGGAFNPETKEAAKMIETQHINCEFYAASDGQVTSELIDIYLKHK